MTKLEKLNVEEFKLQLADLIKAAIDLPSGYEAIKVSVLHLAEEFERIEKLRKEAKNGKLVNS